MSRAKVKPVIGLLGGPGSGKSSLARALEALGCAVIDADEIAHRVLSEPEVFDQVRRWWGDVVVGPDGQPDRAAIGRIVFGDTGQLRRLERLIHPAVHRERDALRARYAADPAVKAVVEDMPLLLEAGRECDVDVLVFVDAPPQQRLARVRASRGWDAAELDRREKSQWPLDTKRARADYVVDSHDGTDLASAARRLLGQVLHGTTQDG